MREQPQVPGNNSKREISKDRLENIADSEPRLRGDQNAEVLIRKLVERLENGEAPLDNFDGQTLRLLESVLSEPDKRKILDRIASYIMLGNSWISKFSGNVVSRGAGVAVGLHTAKWAKEGAEVSAAARAADQGKALFGKLTPQAFFDKNKDYAGKLNEWLIQAEESTRTQNAPGFDKGFWEGMKGLVAQAENLAAEKAHAGFVWLIDTINGLLISIEKAINLALEAASKIYVESMAAIYKVGADVVAYPTGYLAGYLVTSFSIGSVIGLAREMKAVAGFEQVGESIERSEEVIERGLRKEDGLDPRLELIALAGKLEEPRHAGHKLSDAEWVLLASAVRNARISLLEDKTNGYLKDGRPRSENVLDDPADHDRKVRQGEILKNVIDGQAGVADADLELASKVLGRFNESLRLGMREADMSVRSHNSAWQRHRKYARGFVGGGWKATGIPLVLGAVGKLSILAARVAIPGSGLVLGGRKNKRKK